MTLKPLFARNFLSARLLLFVALCALVVYAIFSEADTMRAQQSSGPRATVRRGFTINGRIEGSVQQLTGENTTLNGGGVLTGDLLVPGTPTVRLNGNPTFGGTVAGSGSAQPTNYQVTLNGNAQLGHLVTRTEPIAMPSVAAPPTATGTRDVTLNNSSQSPGNFGTLRELTLNGNVGMITVPPGTYRKFTANGGGGFVLGVAGSTQPAVYNFNSILLNGGSQLQIVGPVSMTTATAVTLNAAMGSASNPLWLSLKVAAGGLTLNGGSALYGVVTAPSGTVTINGNSSLIGNVICDQLTTNGNGLLRVIQGDTTPPVVTIQQPAAGAITNASQVIVTGTFSDASQTTITVNGVAAALNGSNFSATVPLNEGANTLMVHAVDAAGNANDTTRTITRDTVPPAISVQQPNNNAVTNGTQIVVSGSVNDATATTVKVNNVTATLAGSSFSATVPLAEGPNALLIAATDAAGNSTQSTRNVTRDTIAPTVVISQPAGAFTNKTQFLVSGTVTDATATTVTVNNVAAPVSGSTFNVTLALTEGANALQIRATDAAGNLTQVNRNLTRDTVTPVLTIQSPANATLTAASAAIVSGTFSDANAVTLTVNGVPATVTQSSYTATVPLSDGPSLLIATAVDAAGNETEVERKITRAAALTLTVAEPSEGLLADSGEIRVAGTITGTDVQVAVNNEPLSVVGGIAFGGYTTLTEGTHAVRITATDILGRTEETVRNVVVDTTPPTISEVFPASNQVVSETSTTVSGRVTDATAVTVKVNDVAASLGADGVFTLTNFAVSEGANALRIEAIDALGNNSIADSVFLGKDRTAPVAPIVFPVSTATRLQIQQVEGRAEPGTLVNITGGTQPLTAQAADGTGLFFATVNLALGNNVLSITSVDKEGNVSPSVALTINSDPNLTRPPGEPVWINISLNDAQKGLINQELPRPLIVIVSDQTGEPAAGVTMTFSAIYGGGSFVNGGNQVVAVTDSQGHATARYLGGSTPGFQYIRADFPNNPTSPVSFSAELLQSTSGAPTAATGVVMDQNLRALPNVLVRLGGQQTRTGADGRFVLTNVPAGPHQVLELIGRDQIQFPGRWPNISYDFDVLPGVDNNLGRPLFLPRVNGGVAMPLDANNIITSDTVYQLPAVGGLPPIRVTARAGTHVTFPPDVTDKRLSVTRIPVSRTPMTLEDGRAASLYISVQPSGAIFEPALEISFPNLDNLPANEEVLLMSFDHDAGRYVQMGTGHVSADASVVQSDPGSGIRVGAWHALPPRRGGGGGPGTKETTILSEVVVEGNPALEGKDIALETATALGQRGVEYSHANSASGQLSKLLIRVRATMNENSPPVVEAEAVSVKTAKPKIDIDAGAFDYKTKDLFIAEDKEIDLTATINGALPDSQYTYKCSKPDEKKVTIDCNAQTGAIKITGSKVYVQNGNNYDFNAGETSFEIEAAGSKGGNADKAKIKVSLVRVKYKEDKANTGFDSLVKGRIQDAAATTATYKVTNGVPSYTDIYMDDPKNKENETKDPWLTVILNGDQTTPAPGGTQTAKFEVKPDKAKDFIEFSSADTTKATVAADVAQKKLTVTGLDAGDNLKIEAKFSSTAYKGNSEAIGKLNLVVRKRVKVKGAFFYIKDSSGTHTDMDPDHLDSDLAKINQILTPQTGIEYVKTRVYHWDASKLFGFTTPPTTMLALLTRDFDAVVDDAEWTIMARGDTTAPAQPALRDSGVDREFYFVWDTGNPGTVPNNRVAAFWSVLGTIITDNLNGDMEALSHEIGHSLSISPSLSQYYYHNCNFASTCPPDAPHSNVARELMFATTAGRTFIPKADVDHAITSLGTTRWEKGGLPK